MPDIPFEANLSINFRGDRVLTKVYDDYDDDDNYDNIYNTDRRCNSWV